VTGDKYHSRSLLAPVEDGRTAAKSAYTTTDSGGEPIDTTPTTKGLQGTDTIE
jgi:hypothetical protein